MKLYTFRYSTKPDLCAVSESAKGGNLPNIYSGGTWVPYGETDGDHIAGFVSRDLFRDLQQKGFHVASGVSLAVSGTAGTVNEALTASNSYTGFFSTKKDA